MLSCYVTAGLSFSEFRQAGVVLPEGTAPMPRDMCFPVPKGSSWHQLYDYIRYATRLHISICSHVMLRNSCTSLFLMSLNKKTIG